MKALLSKAAGGADALVLEDVHRELLALYSQRRIRPFVSQRFPLERGAEALGLLASRKAVGKLVVTMNEGGTA